MDLRSFWGKAQSENPDHGPAWHPLVFHSLDVAAVGEALLKQSRGLARRLLGLLGLQQEEAVRLTCFLLCLHDIGKFARKFQAKSPAYFPVCFNTRPAGLSGFYDHGAGGLRLFDAARTFIDQANTVLAVPSELPLLNSERVPRVSYALAGIAVLADWIGSNQRWFAYCAPDAFADLDSYWAYARARAADAVGEAGILPAMANDQLDYAALLGTQAAPSPMQAWAQSVELPTGPALFMIEDETGSGKTEAALMLAHRLMASGRADGLYMALPTMATANAMFDRLAAAHRSLFAVEAAPSLALVHGARDLHQGFRAAVLRGGRREASYASGDQQEREADATASTACAAWVADDRRRAFLADLGAGTIDQALLSILPSRHQSLRLLGLMRRVLILDEVHAYDTYMQREIEALLEFQAGLGGSAVLLSATLPVAVHWRLADAFTKGLTEKPEPGANRMDYPLAAVCTPGLRTTTAVAGRSGRARTLPVRFLRRPDEALDMAG